MTDIATNLSTIDGSLSDIKTAIVAKGVTPSGNITTYATAIGQISGGGSAGKYQLLERVKDDSNNEIGTVSGFFTDANDVEYAVVCLDAQYRLESGAYCSDTSAKSITNLPSYSDLANSNVWEAKETATFNTQKILDFCSGYGYTSTACSHCRSKSFIIDGVTYYGQLPNIQELNDIVRHYSNINSSDISASSHSSLNFAQGRSMWSSNQSLAGYAITQYANCGCNIYDMVYYDYFVCPVLELPNS